MASDNEVATACMQVRIAGGKVMVAEMQAMYSTVGARRVSAMPGGRWKTRSWLLPRLSTRGAPVSR